MSKAQNYFYCLKPEKMIGTKLVPLSKLKEVSNSEFKANKQKYKERPEVAKQDIKLLNCKWDDVVFFSCVNPTFIFMSLELLGLFDKREITILKFPIDSLKGKEFCFYVEDNSGKEAFKTISIDSYKEPNNLPSETAKYFVQCVASGEDPLIFSCVPQILLKGSLDIKLGEEIIYSPLGL